MRPSQNSVLPPIFIQVFALVIVTAITAYAIVRRDSAILTIVLGLVGGFVLLGGYYERIKGDMQRAFEPLDSEKKDGGEL